MTSRRPIIFRVQCPDTGLGPYNGPEWEDKWTMSTSHCDSAHQPPQRDPDLYAVASHEKCGCVNPASLLAWFDGWWHKLAAAGFVVTIVRPVDVRVGRNGQAVFDSTDAEERDVLDIETFLGLFAELPETCATVSS